MEKENEIVDELEEKQEEITTVKWDFMEYNHKIHELHYNNCQLCKDNEEDEDAEPIAFCIVCGEHKHALAFCYWCGDVVCWNCCPIPLPMHNHIFEAQDAEEMVLNGVENFI